MTSVSSQKSGHELARAWLRREGQPAMRTTSRGSEHRQADATPIEDAAAAARVFRGDKTRGFFRA